MRAFGLVTVGVTILSATALRAADAQDLSQDRIDDIIQKFAAKEAAFAQMDRGVDILYAERFGVSDAAQERGMLAVGNVIDTQPQYPATVVVSALWHMEPTIDHALAALRSGGFKAEDYGKYSMMAFHGNDLSDLGTFKGKVPPELMSVVAARQADIVAGRFQVAVIDTEPKSER